MKTSAAPTRSKASGVRRWAPWLLAVGGLMAGLVGCQFTGWQSAAGKNTTETTRTASSRRFRPDKVAAIDAAVNEAIAAGHLPGGVLWIEHFPAHGKPLIHHRAYGQRAVEPRPEPMTEDTVFDAASLTKVVATMPVILHLVESRSLDLEAPVSRYLPAFGANGKESVTVRQLLTHTSGLRPGLPRDTAWSGIAAALALIAAEKLQHLPGSQFVYSDINFIVLGEVVRAVTGQDISQKARDWVFQPLKMQDTSFNPVVSGRIAPTERLADGTVLRGVVHDPTARRLGGVAGHAGIFTTAADLARYAEAWLGRSSAGWLSASNRELATVVQSPVGLPRRGLGWDIDSPYAGPRGDVFPVGSYGHSGWTGTSLWIDPFSRTFIIFLSNRNHPTEAGDVKALRRTLGTLAAEAVPDFDFQNVPGALPKSVQAAEFRPSVPPVESALFDPSTLAHLSDADLQTAADAPGGESGGVLTGLDVLVRNGFRSLRGKKVGLITNHTGHDRERRSTIDLLHQAPEVQLVALFSPEHGIRGEVDENVPDGRDARTGLPVYSLYGERRAPSPEQLAGLDVLIFDIQDIGCRFYTYISTLGNCLEAAAKSGVAFVVLDRPNPLGGVNIAGPLLTAERSFVAWHEIPLVHGLTAGELARLFNSERKIGAKLEVIPCTGWHREDWLDATGLPWTNPSPNMRRLTAAALYPGVGLLEYCHLSVGRGTDTPFEILGAPYMQDRELAADLNRAGLKGVRFMPVRFTPGSSVYKGTNCGGVQILVTDRAALQPVQIGITLAQILHQKYPAQLDVDRMQRLLGDAATLKALKSGRPLAEIVATWEPGLAEFRRRSAGVRLY